MSLLAIGTKEIISRVSLEQNGAEEAKLTHIRYLSDYKQGDFGRLTGLLVEGSMLLSRAVVLVDRKGIVRYIQVVPDVTHLLDMEKAFPKAMELASTGA